MLITVYSHCTCPKYQERKFQRKCPLSIDMADLRGNMRKERQQHKDLVTTGQ